MKKTYAELPEWTFLVEEISAGVYQVVGSDKQGHRVEVKGTDYDAVLKDARTGAANLLRTTDSKPS